MLKKLGIFFSAMVLLWMSSIVWANLPYFPVKFPQDEAAHYDNPLYPVNTMTEWWYYNGKLTSTTGRKIGFYVSFNYTQVVINGKKKRIPLFLLQLTDIDKQKVYGKKIILFNPNEFSIATDKLEVIYGKNLFLWRKNNNFVLDCSVITDDGVPLHVAFEFTPERAPLLLNKIGLVYYKNNTNSYYYSYTELGTHGNLQIGHESFCIDSQKSLSWMDHQWGDFGAISAQNQWMWGSIQLENGLEINLNVILDNKTKRPMDGNANVILPNDRRLFTTDLHQFSYLAHPVIPGQKHPLVYDLSIPKLDLKLTLTAVAPGQDINGIWEGISDVIGTYRGQPIKGQANTENSVIY